MIKKLLFLLVLLMTATTGAWAQSAFTAKEITSASQLTSTDDEDYVAACMPSDFLAVDAVVATAWTGAPTDGSAMLIYAIDGNKIKMATFLNGDNKATTGATWSIATFKNQLTNSKFFYTAPPTYSVTMAEGTEEADKWTISPTEAAAGSSVIATYSGTKKVKSVKAVKKAPAVTDLATITANYEAKDGETLTGTLASNVKISIAAGATVTLKDVNITNLGDNCDWAGINCPGDATLVLEGTNTVCAGRDGSGYNNYPGIWIASGKTLTIQGDGTLTAYSNGTNPYAAGIGGCCEIACGNIVINSGTITATGGWGAAGIGGGEGAGCGNITINGGTVTATGGNGGAGIGSGGDGENYGSCGNITISGGTVEATGGSNAAGIGGGSSNGACGTITITSGVTSVKATKGEGAPNSIGKGNNGQDITVNIENGANVTVTVTLTPGQIGGLSIHGTSQKKTINGITIEISGDAHFTNYGSTGMIDVFEVPSDPEVDPMSFSTSGTITFTSSDGKIKRIDINHNGGKWWGAGDGWPGSYEVYDSNNTFTWSGTPAASVTLNGSCNGMEGCMLNDFTSIVFTLEPTN